MKTFLGAILIGCVVLLSNCTKSSNPVVHPNCTGLITDTAGSGDNARIYMPNAFSPNNDGLNDACTPITFNIDSIGFTLYDENDLVVFTTNQIGLGWQTTFTTSTAKKYYYRIQARTLAGKHIGLCGEVFGLTCFTINPPKSFYYFEDMLTPAGFTGTTSEILATCH